MEHQAYYDAFDLYGHDVHHGEVYAASYFHQIVSGSNFSKPLIFSISSIYALGKVCDHAPCYW